jgi:hypothetical protein
MNTVLLTSVSDYTPKNLRNFVRSVCASPFSGERIAFVFTSQQDTIEFLKSSGFKTIQIYAETRSWGTLYSPPINFPKKNVFCDRFLHYSQYLRENHIHEYCIASDCRDVIFQDDPAPTLRGILDKTSKDMIIGLEGIDYLTEAWNKHNLQTNYPELFEMMSAYQICNAGVIAGKSNILADFFQSIYLVSLGGRHHSAARLTSTDQSALNILVTQEIWRKRIHFTTNADHWVAQIGSYVANSEIYHSRKTPIPRLQNGVFINENNQPYLMVHQYDRFQAWKDVVDDLYK